MHAASESPRAGSECHTHPESTNELVTNAAGNPEVTSPAVDRVVELAPAASPQVLSALLPASSAEFSQLDARVVGLWRLTHSIMMGVLLLALAVGAVFVGIAVGPIWPLILGGWLLVAGLAVWLCVWYPRRAFAAWGYRIDVKVLETQSGIVVRVTRLLPLPRLQHVDLQRGPLERAFGLASLVLHTAGTREAVIVIPGLDADEAVRLRNHLVKVGGDDAV